jgi:hypothetical protein
MQKGGRVAPVALFYLSYVIPMKEYFRHSESRCLGWQCLSPRRNIVPVLEST